MLISCSFYGDDGDASVDLIELFVVERNRARPCPLLGSEERFMDGALDYIYYYNYSSFARLVRLVRLFEPTRTGSSERK